MKYTMTEPCKDCPFTMNKKAFSDRRLQEFASGEFPCHKTADVVETEIATEFRQGKKSIHCDGALIYSEKRNRPSQMMRIAERFGIL